MPKKSEKSEEKKEFSLEDIMSGVLKQLSINNVMIAELLKRIPPIPEKKQSLSGIKAT